MSIAKTENGKWLLNVKPGGRNGKQIRKTFQTKGEAKEFEIWIRNQSKNPEWVFKKDRRRLSDLFDLWFESHGKILKSGEDTISRIKAFAAEIGDPEICNLSPDNFTTWRAKKIQEGLSESTCNRVHSYCKAAIHELMRTDVIKGPNPFSKVRQIKIDEKELSFLNRSEIQNLLQTLSKEARNKHVLLITKLCLATGARWSEGEGLQINQLQGNIVQYTRTKSSKARGIPIAEELANEIREHHKRYGNQNRIFETAANAFREGVRRAKIKLPDGQMTHVLRHSFASHFVQQGGNILTLQRLLGHHSITMTMRYAHLAPDHLSDAIKFNPLASIKAETKGVTK